MPLDLSAPRFVNPNMFYFGEEPRTRFLDWLDAIKVKLVNAPKRDQLYEAMGMFQMAAWGDSVEDLRERLLPKTDINGAVTGDSLWLAAEVPTFTFEISGISRIMTHQLVRSRIGVTFSQKGSGERDCRHDDALVPRALVRPENAEYLEEYVGVVLAAKQSYASMVDTKRLSVMMARYALPQCLSQFLYMNITFLALAGMVGKRLCTFETEEQNDLMSKIVDTLRPEFPELARVLVANCDKPSGCYYMRPRWSGAVAHRPDAKHDVYPWNPANYVYDKTRHEMMDGPVFETREYVGLRRVR